MRIALRIRQARIDGEPIARDEMRDDGVAVAYLLVVIEKIGQLPARRLRGVDNVLVPEWQATEFEEAYIFSPKGLLSATPKSSG